MAFDIGRAAGSIRRIESGSYGGNYGALGPISPRTGDRAYGAYQVMGNNVGPWTEKYAGGRMTPQEFLRNPTAQDQVFQGQFGGYVNKYGSGEAASQAWLGGEGSVGRIGRTDFTGTSVGTYSNRYTSGYADPSNAGGFQGSGTNGVLASSDGQTAVAGGRVTAGGTDGLNMQGATRNADGTYTTADGDTTLPETSDDTASANQKSVTGTQSGEQAKGQAQQQGQQGQSQKSGSGSGGSGFGVFMTDVGRAIGNALAPATQQSGQVQAQATEKLAQSTETSGTTIAKGTTDAAAAQVKQSQATNTLFSDLSKDYVGRLIIVLLGIVFVGGGVAMFVFAKNKDLAKMALKAVT